MTEFACAFRRSKPWGQATWVLAGLTAGIAGGGSAACSSVAPASGVDSSDLGQGGEGGVGEASREDARDAGKDDARDDGGGTGDGGPDAGARDASNSPGSLASLASCLGTSALLTVSGQMPYVDVPVGSEAGEFVLDFGSTFSSIDLTAFVSPGPTTSDCDANELGVTCTVAGFAFFAAPSSVELVTADFSGVGGSLREAGILGTDFLSEKVLTLDYGGGRAYAASASGACSASALAGAGFVSLPAAGFFENDLAKLEPFTDVNDQAASGVPVPNVPTVPVRVAGVSAVAQLDTGFDDDATPYSVNINQAFYAAVVLANPGGLARDASLDDSLTTCVPGVSEPVKGYRLAAGQTFDFVEAAGDVARSYAEAVIFVKETPASAQSCGGIGTWSVPAAQVGASFYVDLQTLVFDPFGAQVWVPHP